MGSRLVQDINPEGSSSPNELISINGLLFFSAELEETKAPNKTSNNTDDSSESTGEAEPGSTTAGIVAVMRSDGSDEGTNILARFDSVTNLINAGNELYFIAGLNNKYQLWSSDGTTRGTKPVKDLYPNADPNFPQDLFEIDGVLFYSAIDAAGDDGKYPYVNGYEVWRKEEKGVGSRFFRNLIPDKIITEIAIEDDDDENAQSELILDENGDPIELTTTTTVNTSTLAVEDPLISLASGNNSSDAVDIGFYGLYDTTGTQDLYAGLFRDATDDKFKLFKGLQTEPTTTVNTGGTGYAVGTLVANLEGNVNGTLDNLDSTQFLRSDAADTKTSGDLSFSDSVKAIFGTGNDLEIHHSSNISTIKDIYGDLRIMGDTMRLQKAAGGENYIYAVADGKVSLYYDGSEKLQTTTSGVTVTGDVNSTSDINLKKDIEVITDAADLVKQLSGVKFTWKENDEKSVGVIAQEVEAILPELVKGEEGDKSVNYSGLVGVLIEAVKELSARVEELENKLEK